jgi:hypothetical protein
MPQPPIRHVQHRRGSADIAYGLAKGGNIGLQAGRYGEVRRAIGGLGDTKAGRELIDIIGKFFIDFVEITGKTAVKGIIDDSGSHKNLLIRTFFNIIPNLGGVNVSIR